MREAGLDNVEVLRTGDSLPYAYGEWLGAPGKPTVFLYAHHDVQPVNKVGDPKDDWKSDPCTLTRRDDRLFGRGSADEEPDVAARQRRGVPLPIDPESTRLDSSHTLISYFVFCVQKINTNYE